MRFHSYVLIIAFVFIGCFSFLTQKPKEQDILKILFTNYRDTLNTFDNTYTKDLAMGGLFKTSFRLTLEEQIHIVSMLDSLNFFAFPDTIPKDPNLDMTPNPGAQFLRIEYKGRQKKTVWFYPIDERNHFAKPTIILKDYLKQVIEDKQEYKSLPPEVGGYI